ncbi:MAG: hypothetical protein IKE43_12155 [Coriobacteriales bacterium]|nr:hypothetical protein [Coriobacteriales bacterium]
MSMKLQRIGAVGICLILMLVTAFMCFKNAPTVFAAEDQESTQSYYINATVESADLGASRSESALPVLQENAKEPAVYLYGSKTIAGDDGCGVYLGLLCNFFAYGSSIQAAETGIISDTYGKVVLGNISDGENNTELAAVLSDADKSKQEDKKIGTLVEGGRSALVVQSTSQELSQEYKDYLKEDLALLSASIQAHNTVLKTDLTLDIKAENPEQEQAYTDQEQAYIDHTKGSVILVKSTNAEITLDACELFADENGTGYLIQTVISDDTSSGFAVPDGESYPGISVTLKDMEVSGDIVHEDYQRDFTLDLVSTEFTGALNQYGFDSWQNAAQQEGFEDYCTDTAYDTQHGLYVSLKDGAIWNITSESCIAGLTLEPGCTVNGMIYLDGVEQSDKELTLTGKIEIKPLPEITYPAITPKLPVLPQDDPPLIPKPGPEFPTLPELPIDHVHDYEIIEWVDQTCTTDGYITYQCNICGDTYTDIYPATGHNWEREGGSPASCTEPGFKAWVCTYCYESYFEYLDDAPALGHDWHFAGTVPPSCEEDGYDLYRCSRCGEEYANNFVPATGHNWEREGGSPPDCTHAGYKGWRCTVCGAEYLEYFEGGDPLGHDWYYVTTVPPTCEEDGYDLYKCSRCGEEYTDNYVPAAGHSWEREGGSPPDCTHAGYKGWRCSVCGAEYLEYFEGGDALGHDWYFVTKVLPSRGQDGYDLYKCARCGETYKDNFVPAN